MKQCSVGILYKDGKFLAEKRHGNEAMFPGAVIFPGGHVDPGETPEQALVREMKEELDITVKEYELVGEYTYPDGVKDIAFLVHSWEGSPRPLEAEALVWISGAEELTNELSRDMHKAALKLLK